MILQVRRPRRVAHIHRRADGGAAVRVCDRGGAKAEPIVRLAETRIRRATQELVDRRTVAVGAEEIPAIVPAKTEWIHLPPCVSLDPRAVEPHAPGVAALDLQFAPVAPLQRAHVIEPVRAVQPSVRTPAERRKISMSVALPAKRAEKHLPFVRLAVAIRVLHQPDVRNAPHDTFPSQPAIRARRSERIHADRDVQPVGKNLDLPRPPVRSKVRKNPHCVPPRLAGLDRTRILARFRDPQAPEHVPLHVHRLAQVRLAGNKLDFESWRKMKRRALLHRRERIRGTDEFLEGILIVRGNGGNGAGGEGGKEQV